MTARDGEKRVIEALQPAIEGPILEVRKRMTMENIHPAEVATGMAKVFGLYLSSVAMGASKPREIFAGLCALLHFAGRALMDQAAAGDDVLVAEYIDPETGEKTTASPEEIEMIRKSLLKNEEVQ